METTDISEKIEIPDPLGGALKEFFGLSYLFPYQRLVIANILEAAAARGIGIRWPGDLGGTKRTPTEVKGRGSPLDTEALLDENDAGPPADESEAESLGRQIVILPTGAGKSLCFQLPAMLLDGPTLVIYPILSLMADQERRLKEMPQGFTPVTLRGGQTREERAEIWAKIRSRQSRFIIANPEVLLTPQVMEELGKAGLVHLVIDEAHTVSEWGESFRPSYLRIGEIIEAAGRPLVTAFTATASAPVLEKIEKYVFGVKDGEAGARRIIGNPDRSNICYSAKGAILKDLAVRDLLAKHERPAIVFCSSRKGTENLARYLQNGLSEKEIKFYHAGLSRPEKTCVEKWYFGSPGGVLVATCAYGMGVDKADIRTVIHRDCPPSVEAYLQESGRAGRDGKQSHAFLIWGPEDEGQLRRASTEADRSRIKALLEYAHCTESCRRENLLKLLNFDSNGTSPESDCCDVCNGNALDELREVRPVWDFIRRNQKSYTMGEAASRIASHPAVNCTDSEAMEVLRNLKKQKKIVQSRNFLWKNKLLCKGNKNDIFTI